jgi:type I restriction enzyme S subunit
MAKEIRKLSDLANIFSGNSIPKKKKEDLFCGLDIGTPYVATKDVGLDYTIHYENGVLIPETHTDSFKLAPANSVLICAEGGSAGKKVAHNDRDIHFVNKLFCVHPSEEIISKYIFYYFLSADFKLDFNNQLTGLIGGVSLKKFKNLSIPYTSLEEQKRIVAILDQALADLEQVRAKTEQNLKNARELFDSYLQQVFNRGGFEKVKLGDEIELLTGFAFKSKEYVTHENSIPLIRGDNIVQGQLRWDGVKLWPTERLVEFEKYELAEDDIVLAMDRTWVKAGIKVAKIAKEDLPALLVQRVARLRSKSSLHPDFLYYLIRSKFFESHVLSIQTGLGVPHISGKQIQSFTFNKPSFNEQLQLIKKMNMLSSQVLSLEAVYRCKINYLDELKKSILQKAFSGELTAKAE